MQIQQPPSDSDPHLLLDRQPSNMKVKLEIPKHAMAPSRSLPRSASELGDPASPFSSNPSHHPVTVPSAGPGLSSSSCSSFGRMAASSSPPNDPHAAKHSSSQKKPPTPAAAAAAYYASLWSPRRLMQRAARAFRRSRSRGKVVAVRTVKDLAEERASVLSAASSSTSKVSDEAPAVTEAVAVAEVPLPPPPPPPVAAAAGADEIAGGNGDHAGGVDSGVLSQSEEQQRRQDDGDYHHHEREREHEHEEVVPEKIIHEDAPPPPPPVIAVAADEEKDSTAAAAAAAGSTQEAVVVVESPKKGSAAMPDPEPESPKKGSSPEPESPKKGSSPELHESPKKGAAAASAEDKFVAVVAEAMEKHEAEQTKDGGEAMRRFQFRAGSRRVRTAMEARPESEQPRRREAAPRSNDVIEEACTKLLEKRQCSRVRALAAAFETVMDATTKEVAAAGKPQHRYRKSA